MIARRSFLSAAGATAAGLLLTGCGTGTALDPNRPASAGGTLKFGSWQWLEPGRGQAMWQAIQAYQKANPSAALAQSTTPFLSFADKLNTELGGKGGPDVFVVQDVNFYPLADAGILAPLTSVVASHHGRPLNHTNTSGIVNGTQYGITWERLNWNFFWNRKLLEKAKVTPPTNVKELIAASAAIRSATGLDGFGVRHQMTEFDSWFMDFDVWTYGHGGAWSDGSRPTIDTAENLAGVEAFGEIYRSGAMPIGDDASTMRTKFREGRLAMMIDVSSTVAGILRSSKVVTSDDIGYAERIPLPRPSAHQEIVLAVNGYSKNRNLAVDFVGWVGSDEGQSALRKAMGPSTLATDIPLDADYARANPWAESFINLAKESRSPLIKGFEAQTKAIMREVMTQVERYLVDGGNAATALSTAQTQVTQLIG
ncbi:ABC-type glycerol-3-phosphate transport system substrate-binding protein [Arthrobacter woluwensis]|uniref:extracellular solute-binding protein n=1 Tax=Arthrobacter woluwensis TaxID=156980 RepID=UPI002780E9A4|nr:extracellular solute-binding protein [Arthrobacter woluwensis]MDQ0707775.1 ABC-type glycerol-3-phosphate transport system substrate-binding protein [Arthrobacter woluwensis]